MKASSQVTPATSVIWLPLLALVGSIVSLSIGTSVAKTLFPIVGAAGTTFLRVSMATIVLCAIHRPWLATVSRRRLATTAGYGIVLGAMNLLFYQALRTIPFGVAVAIEFMGPLTLALASSRRAIELLWVACAVTGLGLLLPVHGGPAISALDPVGVAFAFGAGGCWMLYIIIGKHVSGAHGGQTVAVGLIAASCFVAPFGAGHIGIVLHDLRLLLLAIMVAMLSGAIPYSLEMYALRHLQRQTFGILLSLEPAFAAMAAFVILDERLTGLQWVAVASIIVASIGSTMTAVARAPTTPPRTLG